MHASSLLALSRVEPDSTELLFLSTLLVGLVWSALAFVSSRRSRLAKIGPKGGGLSFLRRFGRNINAIPGAIPVGIGAGLTSFGLVGLTLRQLGIGEGWSIAAAFLSAMAFVSMFLAFVARVFGDAGLGMEGQALIGSLAKVTLSIPAAGTGSVAYTLQGQRRTMPARSVDARPLSSGSQVMVMDVRSGVALVEEV